MNCKNCGSEIASEHAWCPNCGTEIKKQEPDNLQPENIQEKTAYPGGTFCAKCGASLRPGTKFCAACGHAQSYKQCANCGAPMKEDAYFCNRCGAKIGTEEKKEGRKKGLIIALVCALVSVLAVGGVLAYTLLNRDSEDDAPEKKPSATTTPANPTATHASTPRPTEKPKKVMYRVIKSDMTWEEANKAALEEGGSLAVVDTEEKFEEIWKQAQSENLICLWIGARRSPNGEWDTTKWLNGTPIRFAPWYKDASKDVEEPSYVSEDGEQERYLTMFKKTKDVWFFNDTVNDIKEHYHGQMGYVIEIEVEE